MAEEKKSVKEKVIDIGENEKAQTKLEVKETTRREEAKRELHAIRQRLRDEAKRNYYGEQFTNPIIIMALFLIPKWPLVLADYLRSTLSPERAEDSIHKTVWMLFTWFVCTESQRLYNRLNYSELDTTYGRIQELNEFLFQTSPAFPFLQGVYQNPMPAQNGSEEKDKKNVNFLPLLRPPGPGEDSIADRKTHRLIFEFLGEASPSSVTPPSPPPSPSRLNSSSTFFSSASAPSCSSSLSNTTSLPNTSLSTTTSPERKKKKKTASKIKTL